MSRKDLRKVLRKVQLDFDFSNSLLVNPRKALSGFSLTPEERKLLTKPDSSMFRQLARLKEMEPEPSRLPSYKAFADVQQSRNQGRDRTLVVIFAVSFQPHGSAV